ncbi:hypothetical protein BJ742DRAFT_829849 [Cladochytrium replicatum]|nr:hypothetical protein BJ742DRAFT_829849 [Cladochytrium replicatum]
MAATASWSSLPPDILGPIFAFLSPSPAHLRNASTAEDLPVAIAVVVLPPCSESRAYFDRAETTSCWKTLLNVALSCRAWSLPALCSLWSNIVIFRRSQAEQLIGVLLRSVEQANGTAAPVYLAYHTFVKSIDFTSLETDTASLFISLTQLVQPFLLSVRLCQSITSSSPVEFERVMSALLACPRLQHLTLVRGVSAAPLRSTHIEQISRRHIRVIGSGAMTKVRPIWLHAHTEEEGGGVVHEPIPDPSIQELLGNMLTLDWGSDVNAFG